MIQPRILEKLEQLPEALQWKVLSYIDSLLEEHQACDRSDIPPKYRVAGTMKGAILMADDFDEPLEDLKDYM